MADHGTPEYATAEGNDYVEHEGTYAFFTRLTFVGTVSVVCLMILLAIGGVNGHWVLFTIGTLATLIATSVGLASKDGMPKMMLGLAGILVLLLIVTS